MKLTLEEGRKAVKLARRAIEEYLESRKMIKERLEGVFFAKKRGVFHNTDQAR